MEIKRIKTFSFNENLSQGMKVLFHAKTNQFILVNTDKILQQGYYKIDTMKGVTDKGNLISIQRYNPTWKEKVRITFANEYIEFEEKYLSKEDKAFIDDFIEEAYKNNYIKKII